MGVGQNAEPQSLAPSPQLVPLYATERERERRERIVVAKKSTPYSLKVVFVPCCLLRDLSETTPAADDNEGECCFIL